MLFLKVMVRLLIDLLTNSHVMARSLWVQRCNLQYPGSEANSSSSLFMGFFSGKIPGYDQKTNLQKASKKGSGFRN